MRLLLDTDGKQEDLAALASFLKENKQIQLLVTAAGGRVPAAETAALIRRSLPEEIPVITGFDLPFAAANPYHPLLPANDTAPMITAILSFLDDAEKTDIILTSGASDLAIALHACPDAKKHISRIIFAGGCYCFGDATPVAETNAFYDPEGLQYLLHTGIPFYFIPLELKEETGLGFAALCFLARRQPELFDFVKYRAETETYADYTRGMTVIYRNGVDHYDFNDDEIASAVQIRVKEEDKNAFYPEAAPGKIRERSAG